MKYFWGKLHRGRWIFRILKLMYCIPINRRKLFIKQYSEIKRMKNKKKNPPNLVLIHVNGSSLPF